MGLQPTAATTRSAAHAGRSRCPRRPAGTRNPTWGFDRIQGALANLGHEISDTTVGNILKAHGIEPAPTRCKRTSWKTFIQSHSDVLGAIDFTTVEVWTKAGLVTHYLLFAMKVATRQVCFAGSTVNPDGPWMRQIARNLTDAFDGFLNGTRYLLIDRDTKYSDAFRRILRQAGVICVQLPPRSPNLNPHIERFMRSLREECVDRLIFFGDESLRRAVVRFLCHFHRERNHQGLENRIIEPGEQVGRRHGAITCRERLAGLLRYYYRDAA
jgi:putative transposase